MPDNNVWALGSASATNDSSDINTLRPGGNYGACAANSSPNTNNPSPNRSLKRTVSACYSPSANGSRQPFALCDARRKVSRRNTASLQSHQPLLALVCDTGLQRITTRLREPAERQLTAALLARETFLPWRHSGFLATAERFRRVPLFFLTRYFAAAISASAAKEKSFGKGTPDTA